MAVENLLLPTWSGLDSDELQVFLQERFRTGQVPGDGSFSMPLAGDQCKVNVWFRGREISRITPGPALDAGEWEKLREEIERTLLTSTPKIGREITFSSYRVTESWTGRSVGVQILPPPDTAPKAPYEIADHPFMLEFPVNESTSWRITNHRRMREHRNLALLLNVHLNGHTFSMRLQRPRHFWAALPDSATAETVWAQEFFNPGPFGQIILEDLSPPTNETLEEQEPEYYYQHSGHDGRGLRVPKDLENSLLLYKTLSPASKAKFDRATYWLDMASRQWDVSISLSFTALVSTIESLTERGDQHRTICTVCGGDCQHEIPGATARFRDFLEAHAPGAALQSRRNKMYSLRSGILHGSDLMQIDGELFLLGFDPLWWQDRELTDDLWHVTRIAVRKWLQRSA